MIKKNIIVNNLKITYYQSSTFTQNGALIFLHGWQSQALHLKSILNQIDNYIAIDLPGFGESERPQVAWGLAEYAEFVEKFLQKLKLENPILIGHSVGGSIIVKYLSNGGVAQKIILIDSAGIREQTLKKKLYWLTAKIVKPLIALLPSKARQTVRKKFYAIIDAADYVEAGLLTESYKKIIAEDLKKEISSINIPTVLMWGANDTATPVRHAQFFQKAIDNSKLYIIPSAGHFPFIDQPTQFIKIFLAEIHAS